jgi:hypothetical protein
VVRILWEQLVQPMALRQSKVDLLHAMAFAGPLVTSCPFVVTIYDLSFYHFPEAFRRTFGPSRTAGHYYL